MLSRRYLIAALAVVVPQSGLLATQDKQQPPREEAVVGGGETSGRLGLSPAPAPSAPERTSPAGGASDSLAE